MAEKYIKLENSIPDACAFRNVVKAIDTRQLHTMFIEWMKDAVESISGVVAVDGKQAREKWSNLQGIGVIFSETEENGKKSKQAHYFIYSCKGMMAEQILEAKRSHWSIENKLQDPLELVFNAPVGPGYAISFYSFNYRAVRKKRACEIERSMV